MRMNFLNPKKKMAQSSNLGDALQNPKILEVNLIRDEVRIDFDWNKNLSLLIFVLFVVGLFVTEIYLGLDWWERQEISRSQAITESVSRVNKEISTIKAQADAAVAYRDKSAELGKLLDSHVYWTNFLSWIEKNTLNTVRFSGFSGDTTGEYELAATAQSYAQASWQVKALLNDPISKFVEVKTVSQAVKKEGEESSGDAVNFNLSLKVDPQVFKK